MKKLSLLALIITSVITAHAATVRGVDPANLDPSVAPGENFYKYACGGWQRAHPLDPQYARFGTFDALAENSREQIKTIITGLGTGNERGSIK